MGLQELVVLKEKLFIRLGRAAFVLRYEQWQLHEAARAASSQPAAQHADDRELRSKEENESRDY